MKRWGALVIAATLASSASCAHETPKPIAPPPPKLPEVRPKHVSVSPPDWYWEPVSLELPADARAKGVELPAAEETIVRVEGANRVWDELGEAGRHLLQRDGIVVLGEVATRHPARWHVGAFYNEWRDKRVPYVVTVDALFAIVHVALVRALAEVAQREVAPLLESLLARIDTRLATEHKGASQELQGGYRIARGVIATARALADEKYVPAVEMASVVREEKLRIEAHAGTATSAVLGVPIDYARFAGAAKGADRAMTWLGAAPFALVAKTEAAGAKVDVGNVRHQARAAMLLARLADRNVEPANHAAFSRLARLFTFVWGPADDITPLALGDLADSGGIDLAKPENITNVARVDKLRALARAARAPALWDGSGGVAAGGIGMRFLGAHAPIDSIALGAFAGSSKVLPTALDLGAWLGAPEARAALRESGADRREGYEATFDRVMQTRPKPDASQLHASVHGSFVEALLAWAATPAPSKPADRARLESVLASWTMVRHASSSFGRAKVAPPAPSGPREIRVSGAPLATFVEAEPETIARLLGTLRQARRGLAALGPLAKSAPADVLLAETEDIVKLALRIAERTTRDEALGPDDVSALAAIPSRMAALETDAADEGGPYAAVIHADPGSVRALVSASGAIEPALVLVREPGSGRIVVAAGAHVTHFEAVERTDASEGAAALLERRIKEGKQARGSWVEAFRLAR